MILLDEIKVKFSIVNDTHSADVIGVVNPGEVNDGLRNMEERFDNDCILLMFKESLVRTDLKFPYAHGDPNTEETENIKW